MLKTVKTWPLFLSFSVAHEVKAGKAAVIGSGIDLIRRVRIKEKALIYKVEHVCFIDDRLRNRIGARIFRIGGCGYRLDSFPIQNQVGYFHCENARRQRTPFLERPKYRD